MIHSLSARSMLLRTCIQRFPKSTVYLSSVKCMSSSSENIVKSSYPDVEISKLSLSNFLLENANDNIDKPAVVSVVCFFFLNKFSVLLMTILSFLSTHESE